MFIEASHFNSKYTWVTKCGSTGPEGGDGRVCDKEALALSCQDREIRPSSCLSQSG